MIKSPLKKMLPVLLLLLAGASAAYMPWRSALVLDDLPDIIRNPALRLSPREAIADNPFRSITYLTYWFDLSVSPTASAVLHITNSFLHLVVCLLFALVTLRLRPQMEKAVAGALAFLFLNPFMWSSVLYVSARSTILAAIGCLSAVHGLAGFLTRRKTADLIEMWAGTIVALFSKESAVVLPFMLLPLRKFGGEEKRFWRVWTPVFVLSVLYAFLRLTHRIDLGEGALRDYTPFQYLLTQATVIPVYLFKFFLPFHLGLEWDTAIVKNFRDVRFLVSAGFLIGVFVIIFKLTAGNILARLFLWWIPLSLMVESSIIPLSDVAFDHRFYMAGVGVTVLVSVLFEPLGMAGKKFRLGSLALLFLIIVCFLTYGSARSERWSSAVGVWREAVRSSPLSFRARYNLGHNLLEEGEVLKAFPHLNSAVKIGGRSPGDAAYAFNARGLALLKMGRLTEARHDFERAVEEAPDFGDAVLHLGVSCLLQGRPAEALEILERAQALLPGDPKVAKALDETRLALDLLRSSDGLDKIER